MAGFDDRLNIIESQITVCHLFKKVGNGKFVFLLIKLIANFPNYRQ